MDTPQDKITRISSKLSSIKAVKSPDTTAKLEDVSSRLMFMEEALNDYIDTQNREFNTIKEEVFRAERYFQDNRSGRETRLLNLLGDLEDNEKLIERMMSMENARRKDAEGKLFEHMDEKFNYTAHELQAERGMREEEVMGLDKNLREMVGEIEDKLREESGERDEADRTILNKIAEDVAVQNNTITNEYGTREASEQAIYDLLKSIVKKIKDEIEKEKGYRERTQDTLQSLLEDTCTKMESASL